MEETNRLKIVTPILVGLGLAAGIFFGRQMAQPGNMAIGMTGNYSDASTQKLQDIINIIEERYVDSVNREELLEKTISDMLHKLDPHSNYISAKDLALASEQIRGEFYGIGIRFFLIRDTVCITNVIPGSPSDAVQLLAGDKILKVDGKNIAGISIKNDDIMSKLKGKANTKVKVEILRDGKTFTKEITRGAIPIHSVSTAYMMNDKTGFIKIDHFSETTDQEFNAAAKILLKSGMKNLVLDLRNNPGGVMQTANNVVDEFLKANNVIVSTKGKHQKEQIYRAKAGGMLENMPLVVLINENSASASEILAGALQDNDRATIVGRRSFGKGLVQQDMPLRDKSSLRLTIARYYTPTGRSIQKPYNGNIEDYYHDRMDRIDNGELYAPDSTIFVDSLKFKTPKGKIVYGGGGIMPDVFVPLDTVGNSWSLTQLRYTASFQTFAFDYANGKYKKWKNVNDFDRNFQVTDALIQQFLKFSEKEFKLRLVDSEIRTSKENIKMFLKAEIARQIWTEVGYYTIINQYDKEVKKALSEL